MASAISDQELETAFEPIDASHFLLIMDSCYSGQALESTEWRRGPLNTAGLAQLAYEKGMYILTASQRQQQAVETSRLGHGLLTYALIQEGLVEGRADFDPKDGQILVGEWLEYASQRVPALHAEIATEAARGMETESVAATVSEVQRPRAYYRPDSATPPLVVTRTAVPQSRNP